MTFVRNGTNATFYIDGQAAGSDTLSGSFAPSNIPLLIGTHSVSGGYFPGLIDDMRLYNRALTATEVQQLYNLGTGNSLPAVSISSPPNDANFTAGANITIEAAASDSDGSVSKVEFFQGTTLLGEDTTSPYSFTWNNVTAGSYSLTAKATDNLGAVTTSAVVNITVNAVSNTPPTVSITSPANNATFTAGANIAIDAKAADTDGTITKVEFFQGTTLLGEDTTSPYSFTWNNVSAGSYSLTAKATDNLGAATTSATVNITVNAVSNTPPTVSITSPADTATFTAGANIAIDATAADSDGTITKVEFFQGATLLGEDTSSPYSFTWNNVAAGSYSLTAKATDNASATTTSAPIAITVGANINNGPVTYIYDELERLVGVVDGSGEGASYHYDAVGNLLSISRYSTGQVSIIEFSPNSAPVGSSVTIYGTDFSSTPSQNSVTFNATAATVTSSTTTQIVATVPAAATTGSIGVTTPNGSSTSNSVFTVAAAGAGAPTISGFTPTAANVGNSVTITGTNFQLTPSSNRVSVGTIQALVNTATSAQITAAVPLTSGGRISVSTPFGKATSTNDFVVLPVPYVATELELVGRMAVGENGVITINTPTKIGVMFFEGVAGQRVSFEIPSSTIQSISGKVYKPDGGLLMPGFGHSSGYVGFMEPRVLPATGTYMVLIDPSSTSTGSLTLNLHEVQDLTATMTVGQSPLTLSVTTPGQNIRVGFPCTTSQTFNLQLGNMTHPRQ